jgi:WD40 repeat protein
MSAALSRDDGSKGVLVDLGERLFTFDVTTGEITDTGLKGAWPVRFSSDGKYVALRSSNSGSSEQLRVVTVNGGPVAKDEGQFENIGHIRPTEDGGFVASARVRKNQEPGDRSVVGVHYQPQTDQLKQIWDFPSKNVKEKTDFDTEAMLGVSTDFRLITHLTDLRNGTVVFTIDNSANARQEMISTTWRGLGDTIAKSSFAVILGIALVIGILVILIRRLRKPA